MLATYNVEISKNISLSNEYLLGLYHSVSDAESIKGKIKSLIFLNIYYDAVETEAGEDDIIHSNVINSKIFRIYLQNDNNYGSFPDFIYNNQDIVYREVRNYIERRREREERLNNE